MDKTPSPTAKLLISASRKLTRALSSLSFSSPVAYVYNPLKYARKSHEAYLSRYGNSPKKILFLGMNPGPWGMAQTGIPFGEIPAVTGWMKINEKVNTPAREHPKRPITGFACTRSEVSGRRLWGLMAERYPNAADFFANHFVVNYCPLTFMSETGSNITPDKLRKEEMQPVSDACDEHLIAIIRHTRPTMLIGVGGFAEVQLNKAAVKFPGVEVGRILHPSPASPAANKDWAGTVSKQLTALGVW